MRRCLQRIGVAVMVVSLLSSPTLHTALSASESFQGTLSGPASITNVVPGSITRTTRIQKTTVTGKNLPNTLQLISEQCETIETLYSTPEKYEFSCLLKKVPEQVMIFKDSKTNAILKEFRARVVEVYRATLSETDSKNIKRVNIEGVNLEKDFEAESYDCKTLQLEKFNDSSSMSFRCELYQDDAKNIQLQVQTSDNFVFFNGSTEATHSENIVAASDGSGLSDDEVPIIIIPGIMGSWYSESGCNKSVSNEKKLKNDIEDCGNFGVKRWILDPILGSYDPLIFGIKQEQGYKIGDVYYTESNQLKLHKDQNAKKRVYLFGYDWKKDNAFNAYLLNQLVGLVLDKSDIKDLPDKRVHIIAHSMGGLVSRAFLSNICGDYSTTDREDFHAKKTANGKIEHVWKSNKKECTNRKYVDQFISVGTPHRGSPSAYTSWVNGDLKEAVKGHVMEKGVFDIQLDVYSDYSKYEAIHGHSVYQPKGIVGVGQLIPDVYDYLSVLKFNPGKVLDNRRKCSITRQYDFFNINCYSKTPAKNYPKNDFLEAINSTAAVEEFFKNVKKYHLFYSRYSEDLNTQYKFIAEDNELSKGLYDSWSKDTSWIRDNSDRSKFSVPMDMFESTTRNHAGDGTVQLWGAVLPHKTSLLDNKIVSSSEKIETHPVDCLSNINDPSTIKSEISGLDDPMNYCTHQTLTTGAYTGISKVLFKNEVPKYKLTKILGYANFATIKGLSFDKGVSNDDQLDSFYSTSDTESRYGYTLTDSSIEKNSGGNKANALLRYDILSPINLMITDSRGRKIGIDPNTHRIINEIPGAWTSGDTEGSGEPEVFIIPEETGVTHSLQTTATGSGPYHIAVSILTPDQALEIKAVIPGTAKPGIQDNYEVTFQDPSDPKSSVKVLNLNTRDELSSMDSSPLPFTDLSPSHPHYQAIQQLYELNIVQGNPDGSFRPDEPVNRAEFVKIALLAFNIEIIEKKTSSFKDSRIGEWHRDFIETAKYHEIIQGYSGRLVKPAQTIIWAEGLKVILKTANIPITSSPQNRFKDVPESSWYAPYVSTALNNNLVIGSGNTFNPSRPMTRAEVADLVVQVLNRNQ